ncbi:MAG TPA: hypothetical protein VIG28_05225 [Leifsonia sp.]|jgi:ornithine carbamoyltransferase
MSATAMPALAPRHVLRDADLTPAAYRRLLDDAMRLSSHDAGNTPSHALAGKQVALVFAGPSLRTRTAFEAALHRQGAGCSFLEAASIRLHDVASLEDAGQVLSRRYEAIAFRGPAQAGIEALAASARVPVWNAGTDEWHPTHALADLLTMRQNSPKRLVDTSVCFVGDGRSAIARSLMTAAALIGMDIRIAAPRELQPDHSTEFAANALAARSGGQVIVTDDVDEAVGEVDFLYVGRWGAGDHPPDGGDRMAAAFGVDDEMVARTRNPLVQLLGCAADRVAAARNRISLTGGRVPLIVDEGENQLCAVTAMVVASLTEPERP